MASSLLAQVDLNWPADKQTAQNHYTRMMDQMSSSNGRKPTPDDFKGAVVNYRWLYKNAPDLDNNKFTLYKTGINIYAGLVKSTEDPTEKMAYQDTVLRIYDLRVEHGEDKGYAMNYKGSKLYKYLYNRKGSEKYLLDQFKMILDLNKEKTFYSNVQYSMKVLAKNKKAGYMLSDEEILEVFYVLDDITSKNIAAKGKKLEKWEQTKKKINDDLTGLVTINCEFIKANYVPQFNENPEDLAIAKKVFSMMSTAKCYKDPAWLKAAIVVNKSEPSYGMSKSIGRLLNADGRIDEGISYFKTALQLAETGTEKGDVYYLMAQSYFQKGSKSTAKSYAIKATEADPTKKEGFVLIGDMYMNSSAECQGENVVETRAIYIAAYNWYAKGGNSAKKSSAKAQFPSIEEIFTYGLKEGDNITIGCWINETVQLQRRPS
jgi:tetratricopeptide (TPR) repeat protein